MEAACEKYSGIVNVPSILDHKIDTKDGTLAKFIRNKGMFHSKHSDDGCSIDDDIYINLGEDRPGDVREVLKDRVAEAAHNGMTTDGQACLRQLLLEHNAFDYEYIKGYDGTATG